MGRCRLPSRPRAGRQPGAGRRRRAHRSHGSPAPGPVRGADPRGERHHEALPHPRAVHLDDEAVRVLQAVGLAEAFRDLSRPAPGLRLVDARGRPMAVFGRGPWGRHGHPGVEPNRVFTVENIRSSKSEIYRVQTVTFVHTRRV